MAMSTYKSYQPVVTGKEAPVSLDADGDDEYDDLEKDGDDDANNDDLYSDSSTLHDELYTCADTIDVPDNEYGDTYWCFSRGYLPEKGYI